MTEQETAAEAVAVILSAGQGTRMRAGRNKVYLLLGGKPLLVRTVEAFAVTGAVGSILLVAHPDEVEYCRREIVERYGLVRVRDVIAGGQTRHQSEERALAALRPEIEAGRIDVVAIHDGARPFITPEAIERVVAAAREVGGALLATPVPADEVMAHLGEDRTVAQVYPSSELWRAQTPQAFLASRLLAAYDAAHADGYEGTDTAASYERLGYATRVVAGSEANVKITTPEDLLRAEAYVRER
jgi:2-C-methyl-D-erythritol 4-phosphate cytidylyltransferase